LQNLALAGFSTSQAGQRMAGPFPLADEDHAGPILGRAYQPVNAPKSLTSAVEAAR
jgi:hypothetical protein